MTKIHQGNPRMANSRSSASTMIRRLLTWFLSSSSCWVMVGLIALIQVGGLWNLSSDVTSPTTTRTMTPGRVETGIQKCIQSTSGGGKTKLSIRRGKEGPNSGTVPLDLLQSLPELPHRLMPTVDSNSRRPLNLTAFDEWANKPIVGSYHFNTQEEKDATANVNDDGGMIAHLIHMPFIDLQSNYIENPPDLQSLRPVATLGRTLSSLDGVVLTRKGNKQTHTGVNANQDRIGTIDFVSTMTGDVEDFWMGLFDGHGEMGHVISHLALSEFPTRIETLRRRSLNVEDTKTALKDIFLKVNGNLPQIDGAGTTGISIWKHECQLYVSNVGDSRAFVVSVDPTRTSVKVIYSTKPHKPDDPIERKRIEQTGGQVEEAPAPGYSARLLIPFGDSPYNVMGLAMSRSLGDFDGHPYGLIAEPTTDTIAISSLDPTLDYLVILASDGLLDRVSEIIIAQEMAQSQLLSPGGKLLPLEAAELLILKSSALWNSDAFGRGYRDDISLAVRRLRVI